MVKQGSVELQGEVQEERLQDYLEKIFPDDDIEEVSKGVKGGDCIQTINYKDKLNIAKIYFESKDTKIFNEQWAKKLLKDMKAKGIANKSNIFSKTNFWSPTFSTITLSSEYSSTRFITIYKLSIKPPEMIKASSVPFSFSSRYW